MFVNAFLCEGGITDCDFNMFDFDVAIVRDVVTFVVLLSMRWVRFPVVVVMVLPAPAPVVSPAVAAECP